MTKNPNIHKSCGDWRGYKAHIWEGGHREPLIVRWPGRVMPSTNALTCLTDFVATCAAIVDTELPDNAAEDSYDILSVLLGEKYAASGHRPVSTMEDVKMRVFQLRASLGVSLRKKVDP